MSSNTREKYNYELIRLGYHKPYNTVYNEEIMDGFYIQYNPKSYYDKGYDEDNKKEDWSFTRLYFAFNYKWIDYRIEMDWSWCPHSPEGHQTGYMWSDIIHENTFGFYFKDLSYKYMDLEDYFVCQEADT